MKFFDIFLLTLKKIYNIIKLYKYSVISVALSGKGTIMKKKKRVNIAIKLLVVLFALYAAVTFVQLNIKNNYLKNQNTSLAQQIDKQETTNDQLRDATSGEPDEEEIESIAREQLGLGLPGEQVFVDTSSK